MNTGDIITIEPTELVAGGDAIARVDGFPIFASNVYPGDVARVRLYEVKKGFAKAEMVEIVKPSALRRAAPCPIADECGGCDWTALRLDQQLDAKRRILSESLRRIGKFDVATLPEIQIHPSPLNYRLRSRLHRDGDAVGFYAMRSNRVVPLARECEVVGVETARVAPQGESWEVDGMLVVGEQELTLTVDQYKFRLHTRAFFQVNRHLLSTLLRLVTAHAAKTVNRQHAVDLYAGVGFFTVPIAPLFDRMTMIEGASLSAHYARMNVPWNVKVIEAPVEQHIVRVGKANFTFLDPPRAGARPEVITTVAEKTTERITYLSCDPVTFARDANRIVAAGWRLASLDLLDLFPNTHHVETLGAFERV
ncbi:MAG TPA: TRAM domain-containing protein [Thermoanaerobaculia bacterium]|nr:TRAM domain-containing protein [Thermoanaerobaculia bacterium]